MFAARDYVRPTRGPIRYRYESTTNILDRKEWTELHRAAHDGDVHEVRRLLDTGADKEARSVLLKQTPLHLAAARGHADLLPLLITPTTLEATDSNHCTPLHCAIQADKAAAVAVLVTAGAPMHPDPAWMWSPFALAISCLGTHRNPQVAMMLLDAAVARCGAAGPGAVAAALDGRSTLEGFLRTASCAGSHELVAKLLELGADRDARDHCDRSMLHCAAASGNARLVPLLASASTINQADGSGFTPLYAAAVHGHEQMVAALLAAGATPTQSHPRIKSALHLAAEQGNEQVVAMLLAAGAVVNTNKGVGALVSAAVCGHMGVVGLLLKALARESGQQQQQQAHGSTQQSEKTNLLQFLVSAALPLTGCATRCAGFVEVVLDVLGPRVAGQMCREVQQQLQAALKAQKSPMTHSPLSCTTDAWCAAPQVSHLAEALLLGWAGAVNQLHAAWQKPPLDRLQRVVPGVGRVNKQPCGGVQDSKVPRQQQAVPEQLAQQVAAAASAAAAGQQKQALEVLGELELLLQQQAGSKCVELEQRRDLWKRSHGPMFLGAMLPLKGAPEGMSSAHHVRTLYPDGFFNQQPAPRLADLVHHGLVQAACSRVQRASSGDEVQQLDPQAEREARSFRPDAVYTTFLAAWVEARRQLKQELTQAVVAAVEAAQQPQQQEARAEETELLLSRLAILHGTDDQGEVASD